MQTVIYDTITGVIVTVPSDTTEELSITARVTLDGSIWILTDTYVCFNGNMRSAGGYVWWWNSSIKQWELGVRVGDRRRWITLVDLQQMGAAASYLGIDSIEVLP